ncbi:unnamed protein product [Closterium sp. NIES-54]
MDPTLSSVSDFVAAVTHIAATRRLDYDTRLVAAPPTHPPSAGGELALGYDILEDRQFELELLAAASPHLCAMLLAHEEEPDAPDISTPRTYVEAASRQRASQWIASMDLEMSSWRSTSTYVDAIPPLWENVVDDMWIFKVSGHLNRRLSSKRATWREVLHTFSPTPKMTSLRVLLHVASQRDYELH